MKYPCKMRDSNIHKGEQNIETKKEEKDFKLHR